MVSFKPCSLGSPGPWAPCFSCSSSHLRYRLGSYRKFCSAVLKKQNITTFETQYVLRELSGNPSAGPSRALRSVPHQLFLKLHFSLSLLLFCVLEASNSLQFSKHFSLPLTFTSSPLLC